MKAIVELNREILMAIASPIAKDVALAWWAGAGAEACDEDRETIQTLYQYAFADGMEHLIKLLEQH